MNSAIERALHRGGRCIHGAVAALVFSLVALNARADSILRFDGAADGASYDAEIAYRTDAISGAGMLAITLTNTSVSPDLAGMPCLTGFMFNLSDEAPPTETSYLGVSNLAHPFFRRMGANELQGGPFQPGHDVGVHVVSPMATAAAFGLAPGETQTFRFRTDSAAAAFMTVEDLVGSLGELEFLVRFDTMNGDTITVLPLRVIPAPLPITVASWGLVIVAVMAARMRKCYRIF